MSHYLDVLTPQNCQLIFIDQQPQMAFGVQSIDRQTLKNNVTALAKAAKVFDVPTTITTVETDGFSGHTFPELLAVFPDRKLLERTSMNSWDDRASLTAAADASRCLPARARTPDHRGGLDREGAPSAFGAGRHDHQRAF
jgi:nicotinamidase-related amidase